MDRFRAAEKQRRVSAIRRRPAARQSSTRRRTSTSSRGSPRLADDEPHEHDVAPRCPRCGGSSVLVRGLYCWARIVLALEGRAA
jgi:hypothetical protein